MKNTLKQLVENLVAEELQGLSLSESWRGFSMKQFKKLKTPEERIAYAETKLPRLGSGTARVVFGLGSGKVLKITLNRWARLQTRNEVEAFTRPGIAHLFAKIYDFDGDNYMWAIVEGVKVIADNSDLLNKFNPSEPMLEAIADSASKSFEDAIKEAVEHHNNHYEEEFTQFTVEHPLQLSDLNELDLQLLRKVYDATKNGIEDIERYDHWGMTSEGRLVLVDSGYGDEDYRRL